MTAETTTPTPGAAMLGALPEQTEILARRLANGWQLIERAAELGEPIEELERHWLHLLHAYETLCSAAE